jgi:ABC-type glycerol-3-phosphate transport system substrate-binding protein
VSDVFPHRRLGVLALALLIALALAACGGSNGGDADVAVGDGGQDLTVAVEDATIAVDQGDGVQLPDSWPAEVPKPDGEPTMATAGEFEGGTGWTVNYGQADAAAYDAYVAALAAAGGEAGLSMDQNGLRSDTLMIGGYQVTVQLMDGVGMTVIVGSE